jgi:hypothetical protein
MDYGHELHPVLPTAERVSPAHQYGEREDEQCRPA